jgi:hypothetical protein
MFWSLTNFIDGFHPIWKLKLMLVTPWTRELLPSGPLPKPYANNRGRVDTFRYSRGLTSISAPEKRQ